MTDTTTITFRPDTKTPGREIAYQGDRIVGDIIPDADGKGGWAWVFVADGDTMPRPIPVHTREEGRAAIERALRRHHG